MPLTPHGRRQLNRLNRTYDPATAKRVLYASANARKPGFTNIDRRRDKRRKARHKVSR